MSKFWHCECPVCELQVHPREAAALKGHTPLYLSGHHQRSHSTCGLLQCLCFPHAAVSRLDHGGTGIWRPVELDGHSHLRILWTAPFRIQLYFRSGELTASMSFHNLAKRLFSCFAPHSLHSDTQHFTTHRHAPQSST